MKIDIKGLDKARVLVALYQGSFQQGNGRLHKNIELNYEKAQELLKERTYFDYLYGKIMKVELGGDEFDGWLYNRDVGEHSAEFAIDKLRAEIASE